MPHVRKCSNCNETKPLDCFYTNRNGLNPYCKDCVKAQAKKWRADNKAHANEMERVRQLAKRHTDPQYNADRLRQCREWYARNAEAQRQRCRDWNEDNRGHRRAHASEYARLFPEKPRARATKRKAKKLLAMPGWANLQAIEAIYLKAKQTGMEVDHIVPLISGLVCGLHCEANLQLLSKAENCAKGNRWWPDMPDGTSGLPT